MLKIIFKNIPYIDETVPVAEYGSVSNVALSNLELWDKIAQDFECLRFSTGRPTQVGRANKYAAAAYLAKTRLYQAYLQDEQHNVTNIDTGFGGGCEVHRHVMESPYRLEDDFAKISCTGV